MNMFLLNMIFLMIQKKAKPRSKVTRLFQLIA